jgi:hypothetical protein
VLHREVYERTPQFEERVAGARLRTYEWQFLANLDGQATVGEILRRLKIDEATIAEFIGEQERNGAIAPRLLSLEEFLSSTEAEVVDEPRREPEPAPRPAGASQSKRTAAEELRAIARLSIAAAIGEILSLISKRRTVPGAVAAPAKPAMETAPPPAPFAAAAAPEAVVSPPEPLPSVETGLRYDRDDLASFQVFDWTLTAPQPRSEAAPDIEAPPPLASEAASNGAAAVHEIEPDFGGEIEAGDVEYLQAVSEENVYFDDGLTIADRLLRDYGPIGRAGSETGLAPPAAPAEPEEWTPESQAYVSEPPAYSPETSAYVAETQAYVTEVQPYVPESPFYSPEPVQFAPAAESANETERDAQRVTFSVNDLAGYVERVEPAHDFQFFQPEAIQEPAFDTDPFATNASDPSSPAQPAHEAAREAERPETIDTSVADPIVFSLSARNPDSFWSGKK